MLFLTSILLLGIGLGSTWIGFKMCEQVYGIALLCTGFIVVIWSLILAPLWLQVGVELFLLGGSYFFSKWYMNLSKRKVTRVLVSIQTDDARRSLSNL